MHINYKCIYYKYTINILIDTLMKKILYSEEKRRILIEERQIDLEEIVDLIEEEKIIADIENPTHQNQRIFIVDYH